MVNLHCSTSRPVTWGGELAMNSAGCPLCVQTLARHHREYQEYQDIKDRSVSVTLTGIRQ